MTENSRPVRTPAKSATKTPQVITEKSECRECGWDALLELSIVWVLGRPLILCSNPWACWERQINVEEHLRME